MTSNTLGKRIKRLRQKAGLSQRALAIAAGIRQPTISALERDIQTWVKGATLLKLAEVLGVEAQWLEHGDGKKEAAIKAKAIDATLHLLIEHYHDLKEHDRDTLLRLAKSMRRRKS